MLGFSHPNVLMSGQGNNVSGLSGIGFDPGESLIGQELGDLASGNGAIPFDGDDLIAHFNHAMDNSSYSHTTDVGVIFQHGHKHLKRLLRISHWRQDPMDDGVQ